jgi:hypothetical protein
MMILQMRLGHGRENAKFRGGKKDENKNRGGKMMAKENKERDEIIEKIADIICWSHTTMHLNDPHFSLREAEEYRECASELLKVETDTLRVAIVRRKPYPIIHMNRR